MNKKVIKSLAILLLATGLSSCGDSKNDDRNNDDNYYNNNSSRNNRDLERYTDVVNSRRKVVIGYDSQSGDDVCDEVEVRVRRRNTRCDGGSTGLADYLQQVLDNSRVNGRY